MRADVLSSRHQRSKPRTQHFRSTAAKLRLDADQRQRQASIMAAAKPVLPSREGLMAFFNSWSDDLGGRPLDLATDSDEGLARVKRALQSLAQSDTRDSPQGEML